MSFSTIVPLLRLSARALSSGQHLRSSIIHTTTRESSSSSSGRKAPSTTRKPHGHAPHGHVDEGVAGPSRCFCTSHSRKKASELPLEELRYDSGLDTYRHAPLSATSDYWQLTEKSRPSLDANKSYTQTRISPNRTDQEDLAPTICVSSPLAKRQYESQSQQPSIDASSRNDFFTPSVQQNTRHEAAPSEASLNSAPTSLTPPPTTYLDSLDETERAALDDRVQLLIRSGERSIPALAAVYGDLDATDREEVACHIMTQCIRRREDARVVCDLHRSWTFDPAVTHSLQPGPQRSIFRRMQSDTLYSCCSYLHAAGLTRQAARVVGDARLRSSQSRYLLERLIYDLKLPPSLVVQQQFSQHHDSEVASEQSLDLQQSTVSFAAADARLAVRDTCDAMTNLMADGVVFKRKALNRMLKLLCSTRARSRVVRLLRSAQRRAQIDAHADAAAMHGGQSGELRAAGGFSRLRIEEVPPPQVVSTKVMEEMVRLLCSQDTTGARTAYELLTALDPSQRTAGCTTHS